MKDFLGTVLMRGWLRFVWLFSARRTVHGIRAAVFAEDADKCFERLDEGLVSIAEHDPHAFSNLQLFGGILVFGNERFRSAYWSDSARLCVVTERYLLSPSLRSEELALTLVHEAMHARLYKAGVTYREGRRAAIEVLCAMAELRLARRIPPQNELVGEIEGRIDNWATTGEQKWSDRSMHSKKVEYLRELGTPGWVVAIVDRLARLIHKRAA